MINGKRGVKDGITYFGNNDNNDGIHINDFSLPEADSGLGPKHFKIYYKNDEKEYYIQDLEEGLGTFLRIEKNYVIFILFIANTKWCYVFI